MSELKTRFIDDTYVEYYNTGKHELAQVYLKSEADKVIAHNKYKRCLAMADFCYTNVHCIMGHRLCAFNDRTKEWFERWHKRWLEIAKKFKEAK